MTMSPLRPEHDWLSDEYVQEWIDGDVPRHSERRPKLRRVASLLPCSRDRAVRILDIGGGSGEFTTQVLEEFPLSTVVLHDYSEPMIAAAHKRLAEYGERVEYRQADLTEKGWSRSLGGPFNGVVSSIAIHNVRDPRVISDIYHEVFEVVAPGGAFMNLDRLGVDTPMLDAIYRAGRTERTRPSENRGGDRVVPTFSDVEQATLENQLRWLREAGFDEVDCLWKDFREILLCGLRSS